MEATVMSKEQRTQIKERARRISTADLSMPIDWLIFEEDLCHAQVEITYPIAFEEGRKAGMEEVVEWINLNMKPTRHNNDYYSIIQPSPSCLVCKWQAKLKEWGIGQRR